MIFFGTQLLIVLSNPTTSWAFFQGWHSGRLPLDSHDVSYCQVAKTHFPHSICQADGPGISGETTEGSELLGNHLKLVKTLAMFENKEKPT